MKNTFKLFGIAVLVATIGLSMAACDTGSTSVINDLPPAGDGSIAFAPGAPPMTFTGVVDQDGNPVPAGTTMDVTHIWVFPEDDDDVVLAELSLVIPGSEIRLDGDTLNFPRLSGRKVKLMINLRRVNHEETKKKLHE
ncbi:MAG: hypothetical protein FWC64_07435 [Treponema sp.]|nr:hypothetical protein [Treponema sp.]